ncbi:MAG TPA: M15 family metallopeptidase [Marmoricola sp.]|nr:M15 family metallopeptidase [Marmoricola sp.]
MTRIAAVTFVLVALVTLGVVAVSGLRHRGGADQAAPGLVTPTAGAQAAGAARTGTASRISGRASRDQPTFPLDTSLHSTTDPRSIWVVVNKKHPIHPLDYRPDIAIVRGYQVATAAAGGLNDLLNAGDRAGLGLKIESAFRSYDYQVSVHGSLVASEGQAAADRISARPGYSEHQTGLAVDLITPGRPGCDFEACFGRTAAGRWLSANVWRYGFLVRYTVADQAVTGYQPEPWHLRYVGTALSTAMHTANVATLEQVFGIPGGDYPH